MSDFFTSKGGEGERRERGEGEGGERKGQWRREGKGRDPQGLVDTPCSKS